MNTEFSAGRRLGGEGVIPVSELNRQVARALERSFPLLWVGGEVSNFTRAASGHWYFSLKDREAQVRCVMFRGRNQGLDWVPREGDQVEARAVVSLYAPRGDFQLGVEQLRRAGAGSLFEAFARLKAKLEAEGLFAAERKRELPHFARAIGVVTSLQAAALRDVVSALRRRAPHVRVIVYPAPVQGRDAAPRLVEALALANARAETDLILLVRGGGSIEDLWSFNDEALARAIAGSHLPVVSGVGHETDFTIADFAADVRAATPTAAAELAAPDRAYWAGELDALTRQLARQMRRAVDLDQQRVDVAQQRLKSPMQRWNEARLATLALMRRLMQAQRTAHSRAIERTAYLRLSLMRTRPDTGAAAAALNALVQRLAASGQRGLEMRAAALLLARARLALLDPAAALARGYAFVTDDHGLLVRDASTVAPGSAIQIQLERGRLGARVEEVSDALERAAKT